jgi:hypothetical protein
MCLVLTTEDENPDRDTGQQANARDKPPSPLYGAENVLNAQDSSSAFQPTGQESTGPHPKPTTGPAAANHTSLPN